MQFKSLVVAGATAAAMSAWFAAPALATVPTVAPSNGDGGFGNGGFCGDRNSQFWHSEREHEEHEPRFWHFNNEEHQHHNNNNNDNSNPSNNNNNNNNNEQEFHHQQNHFFNERPFHEDHEHHFFHFFHQGPCFFPGQQQQNQQQQQQEHQQAAVAGETRAIPSVGGGGGGIRTGFGGASESVNLPLAAGALSIVVGGVGLGGLALQRRRQAGSRS